MKRPPANQAAGAYRRQIGDIVVTALNDGYIEADPAVLLNISPEEAQTLLEAALRPSRPRITVNAFAVHSAARIALIEVGSGRRSVRNSGGSTGT